MVVRYRNYYSILQTAKMAEQRVHKAVQLGWEEYVFILIKLSIASGLCLFTGCRSCLLIYSA